MAIALDSESHTDSASALTLTRSVTPAGSNRYMLVMAVGNNASPASAVFNTSETLTSLFTYDDGTSYINFFGLANPTATTADVVTTFGATAACGVSVCCLTGVAQTSTLDVTGTVNSTNLNRTITVTTTKDNDWTFSAGRPPAVTLIGQTTITAGSATSFMFGYGGPITPAGSTSINYQGSNGSAGMGALITLARVQPINNTLAIAQGSYTYTGFATILSRGYRLVVASGSYTYTGFALLFTYLQKWIKQALNTSSMTNGTKNSSTWTDANKNSSSTNNQTKN